MSPQLTYFLIGLSFSVLLIVAGLTAQYFFQKIYKKRKKPTHI